MLETRTGPMKDLYEFTVNGKAYEVAEAAEGWFWSNESEGGPFATAFEAQADAMRHATQEPEVTEEWDNEAAYRVDEYRNRQEEF